MAKGISIFQSSLNQQVTRNLVGKSIVIKPN